MDETATTGGAGADTGGSFSSEAAANHAASQAANPDSSSAESVATQLNKETNEAITTDDDQPQTEIEEGQTDPELAPGDEKPQDPPPKYNFKGLKVHGKPFDLVDASHEEVAELIRKGKTAEISWEHSSKIAKAADARLAKALGIEKTQEATLKKIQADPIGYALDQGADPDAIIDIMEKRLGTHYTEQEMAPADKRALAAERKQVAAEKKLAKQAEEAKQAETQRYKEHYTREYQKSIMAALDVAGIPKTYDTVRQMADRMNMQRVRNMNPDASVAAEMVGQEQKTILKNYLGNYADGINTAFKAKDPKTMTSVGKQLKDFVGEDLFTAILRYGTLDLRSKVPSMPSNTVIDTPKVARDTVPEEITEEQLAEERKKTMLQN